MRFKILAMLGYLAMYVMLATFIIACISAMVIIVSQEEHTDKTCIEYEKVIICARNHQEYKVYEY